MSLNSKTVDRLFDRLSATYGREFRARYEGVEEAAIKTSWAHELASLGPHLHMIAWALENLPEKAPNVIIFRNLCRSAPALPEKLLPAPKADPKRVAAELAKLSPLVTAAKSGAMRIDHRAWARYNIDRHAAGHPLSVFALKCSQLALAEAA
jgi:hypothetical protein